jgi:organic radical activating enzyme
VFTGGEPLLQLDASLLGAVHQRGFEIAVETNGTIAAPPEIDWLTVSPKGANPLRTIKGQELKLVFPQLSAQPDRFEHLAFDHFILQPMDGPKLAAHTRAAAEYCMTSPKWRLGVQVHKYVGIP